MFGNGNNNNNGMMPAANTDITENTKKGIYRVPGLGQLLSRHEQNTAQAAPQQGNIMPPMNGMEMPDMPPMPDMGFGMQTGMQGLDPMNQMPMQGLTGIGQPTPMQDMNMQGMPMQGMMPEGNDALANKKNLSSVERSMTEQERLQNKNMQVYQKTAELRMRDAEEQRNIMQLYQRNVVLMYEVQSLRQQAMYAQNNPQLYRSLASQIQRDQHEYARNIEKMQKHNERRAALAGRVAENTATFMQNYQAYGQSQGKQTAVERLIQLQQQGIVPHDVFIDNQTGEVTYAKLTDGNLRRWLLWKLCNKEHAISYPPEIVQLVRLEEPLSTAKEQNGTCRHACLMNLLEIRHMPIMTVNYGEVILDAPLFINPVTMQPTTEVCTSEIPVEIAYCPQCAKVYYYYEAEILV